MPDWKNHDDYKFTKSLDSYGWAWEFIRRNKAYRIDYKKATKSKPASFLISSTHVALAEKWGIEPPLPDPKGSKRPRFRSGYPKSDSYSALARYFTDEGELPQSPRYVVLVFDLSASLEPQLARTRSVLKGWQRGSQRSEKAPYIAKKNWTNFLRLLDAAEVHATGAEIRQYITIYRPKPNDDEGPSKAANKLSHHRRLARDLRDHPLRILGL